MRQTDFETTSASRSWEVSAVLRYDAKTRSKKFYGFSCRHACVSEPCGATEEQHVVEGFQPSAVIIKSTLRHDHCHGERVCCGGRISQPEAASCEVQRILDPCSVRLDFDDGSLSSTGSEVVEDVEYDSAMDFSYFPASVGLAQEKRRFSVERAAVMSECPRDEAGSSVVRDCGEMPAPVPRTLQSSQGGTDHASVRSSLRVVRGVVVSLVWFLRPAWVAHDVATRRTERYGVFLTASYVAAFVQCLLFMLGDGCEHQPQPAICQRAGSLIDWSNVCQRAWSLAFALPFTVGVFRLFQRRPVHGVRTQTERNQRYIKWRRRGRCGWALLAVTHLVLLLFFASFVNFYPVNLVWTWVHGCTLSTLVTTMSSSVTRAVNLLLAKQLLAFARGECL